MSLTNEGIEAAREDIKRIWSSYFPANNPWTIAAEKALDALCAAASRPDHFKTLSVYGSRRPEDQWSEVLSAVISGLDDCPYEQCKVCRASEQQK